MIPQEKSAAVTRASREAFGVTAFEDIQPITKGLTSAFKFRIVVRGSPYLLKIIPQINEMSDPTRQFAHMKSAAEAGVAPRVCYAGMEDGICITDFVDTVPFPVPQALARIPRTLHILHALPPFPTALNYLTMHNGFVWRFRAANLLPDSETEEIFTRYSEIAAVYPRLDSDMVSCHNDLKPENILFDGRRVWLVDWEASFLNDRYFDLAIVANFVVTNDAEEKAFLREYFGQEPDEYQLARFFLMRQVMHLLYASIFLLLGSSGKPVNRSEPPLDFRDFHRRIWAGEINLADNGMKISYGRIHWEQLSCNVRQARFDQALRTLSDRHGYEGDTRRLLPVAQ
jgi:aminoglycoside phosphotransferase (APT) family kinase protein